MRFFAQGELPPLAITPLLLVLAACLTPSVASSNNTVDNVPFPADLNGSNFTYPWPVKLYRFVSQGQNFEMAVMDVPPKPQHDHDDNNRSKTALRLHGKNFCAATWHQTAAVLSAAGYRVIIPDQIDFCKSSKPQGYQFRLQQLALNTRALKMARR